MTVVAGSSQQPSCEREKNIAPSQSDAPDGNEAQNSSSWGKLFASYIWPGSQPTPPPPKIHLAISTSSLSYSLSSPDPLKVTLTFTLQQPNPPITVFIKDNIFSPDPCLYRVSQCFHFVDIVSGEKFEPSTVDIYEILDPWQNQMSYRNIRLFATLYPSVPYVVERFVQSRETDFAPMKAGCEYRLEPCPSIRSIDTWWDYGRKWQILKWTRWPFSRPQYADMFDGDEGRARPSPFDITCVKTCSVKVVD